MRYVINKTPAASGLQVIGKPTHGPSPWVVLNPPPTLIPPMSIDYTMLTDEHITGLHKFGPNYVWPPVTVWMGDFLSTSMEIGAEGVTLFRAHLSFDLGAVATAPSTATLVLTTVTYTTTGQDISIQPFVADWGPTLDTGDWGDLSEPAGPPVAGPFGGEFGNHIGGDWTEHSFPIYPAKLMLEAVNYLEIAITDESISGEGQDYKRYAQFVDPYYFPRLDLTW